MRTRTRGPRRGVSPPPPVRDGNGTALSGSEVLEEVDGDLGVLLWLVLRRVHRWVRRDSGIAGEAEHREAHEAAAAAAPAIRPLPEAASLDAAVAEAPALRDPLRTFALLHQGPDLIPGAAVARACDQVRELADRRERIQTAAHFAEAAAYADPENSARASEAGRFCRRAAMDFRAAMWFYRAFDLGVRADAPVQCTVALLRYGVLMYDLGEHDEAEKYLLRAKRRALRAGQRKQAAYAHHELALVAAEARSYEEGEAHVLEALWLYPAAHRRLPQLVYDFGYLLTEKRLYSYAEPLLRRALPLIPSPAEKAVVWASIARAAAGAGRQAERRVATTRTAELVERYDEYAPAALSIVAVAAWIAGETDRAVQFAERALSLAAERQDRVPADRARIVLDGIASGSTPPDEVAPPDGHQIEMVSHHCMARLRKWKRRSRS